MKKMVALFMIAMLLLPCVSIAEDLAAGIDGEWNVFSAFTEGCRMATLDEENRFHLYYKGDDNSEVGLLSPDGSFVAYGENYELQPVIISDEVRLFYFYQNKETFCELLIFSDGVWRNYEGKCEKYLLYNGSMIPASKGEKKVYFLDGNSLFFIETDSYLRGDIIRYGENLFVCVIDKEPEYWGVADGGLYRYFFIRTDIK